MKKNTESETDIALIKNDISYIKNDIIEIKTGIKELSGIFVSREELKEIAKDTELRLVVLEKYMEGPKRIIIPIITAVFASVLTFLVIQFLEHEAI